MLKSFFILNRRLCKWLNEKWSLPSFLGLGNQPYLQVCASLINQAENKTVLDIGAGRNLYYADLINSPNLNRIVGCDIDLQEVSLNKDLDDYVICDASHSLPLPDQSVYLVTSYMCLEHLKDNVTFLNEVTRILSDRSHIVFYFAGGLAPHALINRIFPPAVSKKILYFFLPGSENRLGFPAYYDRVILSQFSQLLVERQFQIQQIYCNYNFREYLSFFFPLYLIGLLIDVFRRVFHCSEFACSYVYVARKASVPIVLQSELPSSASEIPL